MQPVYMPSNDDILNGNVILTLSLTDNDGYSVTDEMVLTFKNGPEAPQTAEGPNYVDIFMATTTDYLTAGIPGINDYAWYLEPAEAGTIQGSGFASTVTWNPDYIGMAYVTLSGIDDCGVGDVSVPLEVTVDNTVGIGSPGNNEIGLGIYPNPGTGLYNIHISAEQPELFSIKISNILGETILRNSIQIDNTKDFQLNLEDLPDGVYFMEIGSPDHKVTRKLVKN
jgi:hypothetical protein